jgi:Protein of unknown function (DUF2975)
MADPISPQVRRLCLLVRVAALLLLASVLALYLGTWAFPDLGLWSQHWALMARVGGLPLNAGATLAPGDQFVLGAVSVPYLACLVWAYWHLELLLRGFERGEFFEQATIRHLRAFAGLLLVAKALSLMAGHVRVAMFTALTGPNHMRIAINVSSDELALLLLCALIFLVAHMMEEGHRLAEENRSFL